MTGLLLVFIDGIGIGPKNARNPFHTCSLPGFERLSDNRKWCSPVESVESETLVYRAIDACLGIEGLPQSGTGQATLFTGINCAELAGRHYGPFPHSTSIPILKKSSIFSRVIRAGGRAFFANAYPPAFFEAARTRNRWSVTTRSCLLADVPISTLADLASGRAIAADVTGRGLRQRFDETVEVLSESEAAERLASIVISNDFTAFEYFLTDRAGHARSMEDAVEHLEVLDRFLAALFEIARSDGVTLLVTSDHGNLEDLSVRTHTRNSVPFAAAGRYASAFASVESLTDVVPAMMKVVSGAV